MPILEMHDIARSFPGVKALDGVNLCLEAGQVHALLGENGAGKSTLMKILGGVLPPDRGHMTLQSSPYKPASPFEAREKGIGFVHQELNLAENLSVLENILLGRLPTRFGWVDTAEAQRRVSDVVRDIGFSADIHSRVGELSVGLKQMVEIARVLVCDADIIIMDEPTAALSAGESERLFEVIRRLRERNKALVYISHRMEEVFALADVITVLRDGRSVQTMAAANCDPNEVIRLMVGREPQQQFPERVASKGEEVLVVEGLSRPPAVHDVSFSVHRGEILGLAGLVGAGRSEIARLLCGADQATAGRICIEGKEVRIASPSDALEHRLAYAPEDRKADGLVLSASIHDNMLLASFSRLSQGGWLPLERCRERVEEVAGRLLLRASSIFQPVQALSGGNQQKVLLGRWLVRDCNVLLLDEPTRGVDIGARAEIYRVIDEMSKAGAAILLISSDLLELLALSDRVAVIRQGRIVARFNRPEATAEAVMTAAFGA